MPGQLKTALLPFQVTQLHWSLLLFANACRQSYVLLFVGHVIVNASFSAGLDGVTIGVPNPTPLHGGGGDSVLSL